MPHDLSEYAAAEERLRWLNERKWLIERIRNQRASLRKLNATHRELKLRYERQMIEGWWRQARYVEQCAKIAERFWFSRRIAKAIRRAA